MMESDSSQGVRVVTTSDITWKEAFRGSDETEAWGRESTNFEAGPFSTGFWQRDEQARRFERPYHEIAYIIEGEVELTMDDGQVICAGPGDVLITPKGSSGFWRNLSPVRKFWAIFE